MIQKTFSKLLHTPWLPHVLSLLAVGLYIFQAWTFAHTQSAFVDEGGYLYIGALQWKGLLQPFQEYGPPGWYAPLSTLVPGLVEHWFGAGLLTGRLFSVFCGVFMLLPLFLTARRMAGRWGSTAVLWSLALTPISIQVYSLAISEALVACLLAWSLFFVLGTPRSTWLIAVGAFLAGVTVMVRQNMFLLPLLMVGYVFWQHGKKAGWWALVGSLLPILVIHLLYWPNILQLWVVWLPARLTPFLDAFRPPAAELMGVPVVGVSGRLASFVEGFRFHYFSLVGFVTCLLLWPRRGDWKNPAQRKAAWFLSSLFLFLLLIHAWVSFLSPYEAGQCIFCFTPYLSFFDITALLLIILTFPSWRRKLSSLIQGAAVLFILLLATALGYASFDRFGTWLLGVRFPAFTRGWNPQSWTPFITLWDILSNKFHQDYWESRVRVPVLAGLVIGLLALILLGIVHRQRVKKGQAGRISFGALALLTSLGLGIWLSPLMGGTYRQDGLCKADFPNLYQQIGDSLEELIPPGSRVYWEADTVLPLLYAPGISIPYPQIYGVYSFRAGDDTQALLKNGLWNAELAARWRAEADFIVTEADWYQQFRPGGDLDTSQYGLVYSHTTNPCVPNSSLVVYQRNPGTISP